MRVLFITTAYPTHPADPRGTFIRGLAHGLRREGIEMTVLVPGAPGAPALELDDGVRVQRVRYWAHRSQALATGVGGIVPNLRKRPWLAAQLPALVGTIVRAALDLATSADLIHAHWVYPSGLAGLAASRRYRLPLVITSHGGDLNLARRAAPLRMLARWVSARADACVGVSHAMVESFLELGIAPDRIRFIPLGVELSDGPQAPALEHPAYRAFRSTDAFRVVYVGSLIPRKSVSTLLEAHRLLELRGHRLATLIVGSGPSEPELRAMVAASGLTGVYFAGEQPPAHISAWIYPSHVLVLPSLSEGRGLVLLEAMALGRPVVASDIPGPRELVLEGKTGLLFPPGQAAVLADRLASLIRDPALREHLGRGGHDLVLSEGLTVRQSARRHVELYQSLIRHDPAAGDSPRHE